MEFMRHTLERIYTVAIAKHYAPRKSSIELHPLNSPRTAGTRTEREFSAGLDDHDQPTARRADSLNEIFRACHKLSSKLPLAGFPKFHFVLRLRGPASS
eukprot:2511302-Rhodomonas_salina.3